ncbi:MAG: hypothetical protein IRY99_15360 [Isosphaeraceae bacterium]|nr:hypothetical protein [Isosphaeraceae bacterium]
MLMLIGSLIAAAALLGVPGEAPDPSPSPSLQTIRAAVERALVLIQKSALEYPRHRDCYSCHHQGVPTLALTLARDRGFAIEEEAIAMAVDLASSDLGGAKESYRQGRGQGGGATRAGYALWTLELGQYEPDDVTAAVVEFLLIRDQDLGHWRTSSRRPPSEASPFTTTAVALRGLKAFGTPAQQGRIAERVAAARRWLEEAEPQDTEDRVFRLWGLKLAGASNAVICRAADDLRKTQRDDGGWAQLDGLDSDAYATGSALVALHLAGGLPTTDPAYCRGLAFLWKQQRDDGSWHVRSRSKPFQPYFESGFPHGPDQFLSIAASGWATAALALACPPMPAVEEP